VETSACEAASKLGITPSYVADIVRDFGGFDAARILEIEKSVKHDVIAFLTNVGEFIVKNAKADDYKRFNESQIQDALRYLHYGMTSSDLLDTTFSYQLVQSCDGIVEGLKLVLVELKEMAIKYKYQVCIGRSHGVHAEPISFGQKILGFYSEFKRSLSRLTSARNEINSCMISGPVGNFAALSPFVENYVAQKMNMNPELCSTQVIPRDRYAYFFSVLGVLASSIEHLASEVRHLQRTEVLEVEEGFGAGQKGSSAMPHKKNPILSENLTGLARMIRSYVVPAMENVALLHERDISHSSVERVIAPDACILTDFALNRVVELLRGLVVHKDNMEKNLGMLSDIYLSHITLLSLVRLGLTRDDGYKIVQRNSMNVWSGRFSSLVSSLESDQDLLNILEKYNKNAADFFGEIKNFNYLEYVDDVFDKVLIDNINN
jgi:adenylosuccinate lyase